MEERLSTFMQCVMSKIPPKSEQIPVIFEAAHILSRTQYDFDKLASTGILPISCNPRTFLPPKVHYVRLAAWNRNLNENTNILSPSITTFGSGIVTDTMVPSFDVVKSPGKSDHLLTYFFHSPFTRKSTWQILVCLFVLWAVVLVWKSLRGVKI